MNHPRVDITIVGGGFAGLAAGLRLQRAGAGLRILEKRPCFGGRAYSFQDKVTGDTVDNGQHLLLGCYHETLRFLGDLGTLDRLDIQESLDIVFAEDAQSFHHLKCPNLPAPFHLGIGLLRFKGLGFKDKLRMTALLRAAKRASSNGHRLDEISIKDFMAATGQTPEAVRKFWEPIGLGALNESIELASAQLFAEVIRRALLSKKSDSNLAIASVGLSELYAEPAREYFVAAGVPLHFQVQVKKISREGGDFIVETEQERFRSRALLLAVPPNSLQKILEASDSEFAPLTENLSRFHGSPIVSVNLWIEGFNPADSLVGLIGSPMHWMFNKGKILKREQAGHVTLVVSGAQEMAAMKKEELVALASAELKRYYPEVEGKKLLHSQVIKEFEATFGTRVGLNRIRPAATTSIPGLFLAGDWTDTGLPATIESAVLSGHRAAEAILERRS